MWSVVWTVGLWVTVALLVWSPFIIFAAWVYGSIWAVNVGWVWASSAAGALTMRWRRWKLGLGAARREEMVMKGVRRAASDDGFMRAVIDALPGVETDKVMNRIGSLTKFSVSTGQEHGARRRMHFEPEETACDRVDMRANCEVQDRHDVQGLIAPLQEDAGPWQRRELPWEGDAVVESEGSPTGAGKMSGGDLLMELVRKGYMVVMTGREAPPRGKEEAGAGGGEAAASSELN